MQTDTHSKHLVLLVDDEADIREVLKLPLEDLGYDVRMAANAISALAIFRADEPAIVITDIKMPGMDGIELLREIKQDRPTTEVIMITGHGDMDLAIESLKYEATDFVIKPINVDALEIALDRVEEKIRVRRQLAAHTRNLEKLIQEKAEIQDHLASLGLLIGSVSHGIKGLMTHLDGGIYLLDSGIKKKDFGLIADGRNTLKKSAMRIKKMVQDILYYAKERPLKPKAISTAEFAKEVIATIEPRLIDTAIELVADVARAPKEIVVEPESLHAALINILDNAIEACEKNPARDDHCIEFIIETLAAHAIFIVKDDGIGMDRETREKMFSLFFSCKGRRGTGLGLFIANKIVSQHKGTISVNSTPGCGCAIRIQIPMDWVPEESCPEDPD